MYKKLFTFLTCSFVALSLLTLASRSVQSRQETGKVDFRRDVQPLLRQYCIGCHGPTQQMNGFRLDRRRDAMRGGTVAMIAPGNSQGSRLYLKLIGNQYGPQMPPTGALRPDQITVLKAWIDQGAEWPDELSGDTPPAKPDPGAPAIMNSIRNGDRMAFRRLIQRFPNPGNLRGAGGTTVLMQAVLYGNAETVRLLLSRGADPNLRNEAGATALMWAADDPVKTRLLLDRGADVNARSEDSRTALLIAAGRVGSQAVVRLLLDRGADLTPKSPGLDGDMTVVTEASRVGDESLLRLLIDRGADLKAAGPGPMVFCQYANCDTCLDVVTAGAPPDLITLGALLATPPFLDASAMNRWLQRGADVHPKDPFGNTLLMLAASSDSIPVDVVKTLIARGVDVNARNADGRSALDFAKLRGATPVVDLLSRAGAKEGTPFKWAATTPSPAKSSSDAIARSVPLLQKSDSIFLQKSGCVSCHNNTLTSMALNAVRKRGLAVDERAASSQVKRIATYIESWRERAIQGVGIPGDSDTVSYILAGLADAKHPADVATDALARFVKGQQHADGGWRIFAHRPPIESSDVQVTAVSLRALRDYAPKARKAEYQGAVSRAANWLLKAEPKANEDRVFQLLGLRWSGLSATHPGIRRAMRGLLAQQRSDGGWSQLSSLGSDAYATGQALVALRQGGGLSPTDPAYQRGVAFLLRTQMADGSWFVQSRAIPLQPYFESGFPHGRDQWVSMAGTSWAVTALALGN